MTLALIRRGVHASAVGHGVAHAIYAVADNPETTQEWLHRCCTAADEAEAAVAEAPREPDHLTDLLNTMLEPGEEPFERPERRTREMIEAGAAAYQACMPQLTGRRTIQAYIACVAVAVQRSYFSGAQAKALLYTAQLALSAHPARRARSGRKAKP